MPTPAPNPSQPAGARETYVFLSYARADLTAADAVENYLRQQPGVRVFRDRSDIHPSEDWTMKIHHALRECQQMVLLLSPASMPDHEETRMEWLKFGLARKPIYSLYLAECDLHYRLSARQFINADGGLPAALERLRNALIGEYELAPPPTVADRIAIIAQPANEPVSLAVAQQTLAAVVNEPPAPVVLTEAEAKAIGAHSPADLHEYRLSRIAEWSLPRYQLDQRFVSLTLSLDKGETEPERFQRAADWNFSDLREVINAAHREGHRALVLLGAPGSGKSTVLRRLQLDHSLDRLRDGAEEISLLLPLNSYPPHVAPRVWLNERWAKLYPHLPPLETWLAEGKALLLLDALNEMPHRNTKEYFELVALWRGFVQEAAAQGNRLVFTCRSLDYSARLSAPELRVPQVQVQPMDGEQMRKFMFAYCPTHAEKSWVVVKASGIENTKGDDYYHTQMSPLWW